MRIRITRQNRTPHPVAVCYSRIVRNLIPLLGFYLAFQLVSGTNEFYIVVNGVAPIYLIMALIHPVYRLLRTSRESIWSTAVWFPISSAVFFGFGPLVSVYGNEVTQAMLASTKLAAGSDEIFRANMLSTVGIFGVMWGFWLHTRYQAHLWWSKSGLQAKLPLLFRPLTLALLFVVVGAVLRYGVMKPSAWGMVDFTVPGVIATLGPLIDVGFGILAFVVADRKSGVARSVFWGLWPVHVFLCVLSLAKAELITALLLPALGAYLGHGNRRRLAATVPTLVVVFIVSQPWVHYGRGVVLSNTGTISQASYQERVAILANYLAGDRIESGRADDVQGWWTRLDFSHKQAYAMHLYDSGSQGWNLDGVWMRFVPRFLWPDKPILEGPGKNFHSLVTGGEGTSFLALSVYGDLYWQFGWLGLIAVTPLIGWVFGVMGWRAIVIMRDRQFIMFPIVLIALETGMLGMNKFLINGIINVIPLYFGYVVVIEMFLRLNRRKQGRKSIRSSASLEQHGAS